MSTIKTIGIIVFDDVLTSEVMGLAEVFRLANEYGSLEEAQVLLIGVEQQATIHTAEGIQLTVDANIRDDIPLDVLLVPGANDMSNLLQHSELNAFIQKHDESSQWLGSVCAGAFVLGNTGVLDGQQATTWFGGEPELQRQFPSIQVVHDRPVVLDKRRITANGGLVSYRAAIVLLGQLTSPQQAKEIYDALNMDRLGTWEEIEASIADEQ